MTVDRVGILLDGEYVKKTLRPRLARFPRYSDIMAEVERILSHDDLVGLKLYRIFYYTAEPLTATTTHPLDGTQISFAATKVYSENKRLIDW